MGEWGIWGDKEVRYFQVQASFCLSLGHCKHQHQQALGCTTIRYHVCSMIFKALGVPVTLPGAMSLLHVPPACTRVQWKSGSMLDASLASREDLQRPPLVILSVGDAS